jgi:streptogramin lyase
MATNSINDLIATKLALRYPGVEKTGTALLQRYRADNGLDDWAEYVAHVAGASPENNFVDDQSAFWLAFVP